MFKLTESLVYSRVRRFRILKRFVLLLLDFDYAILYGVLLYGVQCALGKNLHPKCVLICGSLVFSLPPRTCRLNNAKRATHRAVCKEGVMSDIYDRVQYIYLKIVIYNAVR